MLIAICNNTQITKTTKMQYTIQHSIQTVDVKLAKPFISLFRNNFKLNKNINASQVLQNKTIKILH